MDAKKIELTNNDYLKMVDSPSKEFISTMIDIINKRAKSISACKVLKNYETNHKYFYPSNNDVLTYNKLNTIFFQSVMPEYECIELSPITPFALNSTLTPLSPNNSLSTIRNSEVISDSSISMALECAHRRKIGDKNLINLASSTRLLRMQKYGNGKKEHWTQHFRACSLVTSFRNNDSKMFESLYLQISKWLDVIYNLNLDLTKINVNIAYLPIIKMLYKELEINEQLILKNSVNPDFDIFENFDIEMLEEVNQVDELNELKLNKDLLLTIKNSYIYLKQNLIDKLKIKYPNVNFNFQLNRKSGINYYEYYCFETVVTFENGYDLCLVDGGITNWTGMLLSDSKEKCVSSGMGLEYLAKVYRK